METPVQQSLVSKFGQTLISGLMAVALAACSGPETPAPASIQDQFSFKDLFSNRPQTDTHFLALVKLQEPALLADAIPMQTHGVTQIDPERLKVVLAEQDAVKASLAKLSTEIQILQTYKYVMNGFAILAPKSIQSKIKQTFHVAYVEMPSNFELPRVEQTEPSGSGTIGDLTSVTWIGGDKVHQLQKELPGGGLQAINGHGIRVGVIDTGIDYTHSMFGGPGTSEAYKGIAPSDPSALFPNSKIKGGIDLVGTDYDSASLNFANHIPKPDGNPLDEQRHGTHVAGTIGGIGDGVNTYSGVAPDSELYAIKVFGKEGSTSDLVVMGALEYAADPGGKGDFKEQLHVVNLSLGSGYGEAKQLYNEAVSNLVHAGTSFVASAGNSGANDYITGSPASSDDALSVAASVDGMDHNWKFSGVRFSLPSNPNIIVEAVEGSVGKPIVEAGDVHGELVYVGLADKDFAPEVASAIAGKIALIDRGVVPFSEKVRRAFVAKAIGVVVANNQPGQPFAMGGNGNWDIPAIMISFDLATQIKSEMPNGPVSLTYKTDVKIEKPQLIDTLADFSSKGPRSGDGYLKPEISAPGSSIISASMGEGNKGVKLSGTSMASPHMAGVMALMVQAHPDLSPLELKSLAMGTARSLVDSNKMLYPLSLQGSGRVDAFRAVQTLLVADVPSLSLGEVGIEKSKAIRRSFSIRNFSSESLKLAIVFTGDSGIAVDAPSELQLGPNGRSEVSVVAKLDGRRIESRGGELGGWLKIVKTEGPQAGNEVYRIPVLAVLHKQANIAASNFLIHSTSSLDSAGSAADLKLSNLGVNSGDIHLFNLLGADKRKSNSDPIRNQACDLQAAGYRITTATKESGEKYPQLQIAVKLFNPVTTWNNCEVNVQIDTDGDQLAEQEIAGVPMEKILGVQGKSFVSYLVDAVIMRALRLGFEQLVLTGQTAKEEYVESIVDVLPMTAYDRSTVAIVTADLRKIKLRPNQKIGLKIATLSSEPSSVEADDFLDTQATAWKEIDTSIDAQPFRELTSLSLKVGENRTVEFSKGQNKGSLLVLFPDNRSTSSLSSGDDQMIVAKPKYDGPSEEDIP